MSSPTTTSIDSPERRPSVFLSLAPATSASYPQTQASRAAATEVAQPAAPVQRRSSSVGSNGYKVLKLGPVHWGEHADDHKADFHEVFDI